MNTTKPCTKCLQLKNNTDFEIGRNQCKSCRKTYLAKYYKSYYEDNKVELLTNMSNYSQNNKEKIKKQQSIYCKNRRAADIQFKIASNLRSRLSHAIKDMQKGGSAIEDLGCSIQEFKSILESKFHPGMSWTNYGEWHIDHIIPLSKFNLADTEQLKKACHYSNLQPMWAKDNWSKGAKWL